MDHIEHVRVSVDLFNFVKHFKCEICSCQVAANPCLHCSSQISLFAGFLPRFAAVTDETVSAFIPPICALFKTNKTQIFSRNIFSLCQSLIYFFDWFLLLKNYQNSHILWLWSGQAGCASIGLLANRGSLI